MEVVARVIRNTPVPGLKRYFSERFGNGITNGELFPDWNGNAFSVTRRLLKAFPAFDQKIHATMSMDFDRVFEMTDESGQQAIAGVLPDQKEWKFLENAYDRAMWLFLNDLGRFRQAEEVRFAEHNRQGRRWSGFVGPRELTASRTPEHRQEFEERVCTLFKTEHARLELYDRFRFGLQGERQSLTQAVIYREGLPNGLLEFKNGELSLRSYRPVLEAVITYDQESGAIEVVGQDSRSRPRLARLFAEVILRQRILGVFLPLRQYDLSSLKVPRRFPTDPEDGISHISVMNLALYHEKIPHASFIVNLNHRCELTPYEYSEQGLDGQGPLGRPEFKIFQAVLSVHFRPDRHNRSGKSIPLKLTLPNGCDLKGKTEKERLICGKYLPRWGLVKET